MSEPGTGSSGQDAYEDAPCGLLSLRPDGTIARANHTLSAWTGYGADELRARRLIDLLSIGSKLFHQTHWLPLLEMQGSVAEVQLEIVTREGRVLPTLVNAVRRSDASVDVAVFLAADRRKYERELLLARRRAEELLEREQEAQQARASAEARLRLALESAKLRVWSVELPSGHRHYEAGVSALIGAPELEQVTAEQYTSRIHPQDQEREAAALASALAGVDTSVEYRLLGYDGVERMIASIGRAFFDAEGNAIEFSGVLEDVTDRRRAEDALKQQGRDAQQRAVLAEQLIGIVSHDLRNPLNAILLGTQLLDVSSLGPHARVGERIASAAQRASRLITDLLDFTQARLGGGLRVSPAELDLHALIAECVEELRLAAPGRTIEHRHAGHGMGMADPDRLAQIVTNLANNALTYGAPDEPVSVTSVVGEAELEIQVQNAGRPIPLALQEHIFEPLRRGDEQVQRGSRSVGLGLYIVREIASAHGGTVTLRSNEAEGTSFRVTLPRFGSPE